MIIGLELCSKIEQSLDYVYQERRIISSSYLIKGQNEKKKIFNLTGEERKKPTFVLRYLLVVLSVGGTPCDLGHLRGC